MDQFANNEYVNTLISNSTKVTFEDFSNHTTQEELYHINEIKNLYNNYLSQLRVVENAKIDSLESTMIEDACQEVKESKSQFFAMTSYTKINDNSKRVYFRNWRGQENLMTNDLVEAMLTPQGRQTVSVHTLVIPPIQVTDAIEVGLAGKNALDNLIKTNQLEWKDTLSRGKSKSLEVFQHTIGCVSRSVFPTWTPNDYISHDQFVECFLNESMKASITQLQFDNDIIQKLIAAISKKLIATISKGLIDYISKRFKDDISKGYDADITRDISDDIIQKLVADISKNGINNAISKKLNDAISKKLNDAISKKLNNNQIAEQINSIVGVCKSIEQRVKNNINDILDTNVDDSCEETTDSEDSD